jgi:hypothetical protein
MVENIYLLLTPCDFNMFNNQIVQKVQHFGGGNNGLNIVKKKKPLRNKL